MSLKTITLATLLGLSFIACNYDVNYGKFRDYQGKAVKRETDGRKEVQLIAKPGVNLSAVDENLNGRFDIEEINSRRLPENHPLRAYANPDSLELAYRIIMDKTR